MQEEKTAIETKVVTLRAELSKLDSQIVIQRRKNTTIHEVYTRIAPLQAKGYISILQLKQQEASELDTAAQIEQLGGQSLGVRQQIDEAINQQRQLPLTVAIKKRDLEIRRADIETSLAQNEFKRASVLRATKEGIVSSLLIKQGQAVSAGQPLLTVQPNNSPLQAVLLVPSSAIGFVHPGSPVVLRYQAYPFQKFGLHQGCVKAVSRSAMTPTQVASLIGEQSKEGLYRVDVQLDAQAIQAYGSTEHLKPGLVVEADILLDKRRLIEWAFEPLYAMRKSAPGSPGDH